MRHFLGYKSTGEIATIETFGPGGWPTSCGSCEGGCDPMTNINCVYPPAVDLKNKRANRNPEIVGYVLYDCPCSSSNPVCQPGCYNNFMSTHYVDVETKTALSKPSVEMQIDAVAVADKDLVDKLPGTDVVLKLVGPDVPDGATATCSTKGPVDITPEGPDTFQLTFSGGVTNTKTLTTPAQGSKGRVFLGGKYVRFQGFTLRGWT